MVLAHHVAELPIESRRILEIGCGMALSSLLLNKRLADITATDYHPDTGSFLQRNTALNHDRPIAYEQTDWASGEDTLGRFDLIIGSDLLYENIHIELLANFIEAHALPSCEVILIDPGRGRKNKLSEKMVAFGFSSRHHQPEHTDYLPKAFKGHILCFSRACQQ